MILVEVTKRLSPLETIAFNPEEVKTVEGINGDLHGKVILKDGREIETWESYRDLMTKMKKAMVKLNEQK